MMQVLIILLATLVAMITLILINSAGNKPSADQSKISLPIEDETDHKRSD